MNTFNMTKIENKCLDASSSGVFIQRLTADTTRIADVFTVLFIHLTNMYWVAYYVPGIVKEVKVLIKLTVYDE